MNIETTAIDDDDDDDDHDRPVAMRFTVSPYSPSAYRAQPT